MCELMFEPMSLLISESCDIDRHCPAGYPMTNGISALGFKVGSPPTTEGYNIYIYIYAYDIYIDRYTII